MRILEQAALNDYIKKANKALKKYQNIRDLYRNAEAIPSASLQQLSYKRDLEFFKEISNLLSVIVSIISHPHISNKREEVVVRVEQARNLQPDAFRQVLQDSSLWKNHNGKMIPEHVHYFQHVDELRIYENQFIVMLVNMVDAELNAYNSFYLKKLPTVSGLLLKQVTGDEIGESDDTGISSTDAEAAIKTVDRLKRRIRFIKNTYFYKEVSKGLKLVGTIKPTNILLKDRLYRVCYKFYRKFIRYEDASSLMGDMQRFYYLLCLKELFALGFKPKTPGRFKKGEHAEKYVNGVIGELFEGKTERSKLTDGTFDAQLYIDGAVALELNLCKKTHTKTVHLLGVNPAEDDEMFTLPESSEPVASLRLLSVWNAYNVTEEGGLALIEGNKTELEMVREWILSKLIVFKGDHDIYARYCPVCKSRSVDGEDDLYKCSSCGATFAFANDNDVWLSSTGRE